MQYSSSDVRRVIETVNRYTKKSFQYESTKNIESASRALEAAENMEQLTSFIIDAVHGKKSYSDDINKLLDTFVAIQPYLADVMKSHEPRELTPEEKQMSAAVASLGDIIAKTVAQADPTGIKEELMASIKQEADKYIHDTYGAITRKTNVIIGQKTVQLNGVTHEKFDEVLEYVANDEPVFLTGPAGTGKNYLCKQIAQCLGLPFYFTNAVTQEYKITGFTDANGKYQETEFYKAFKDGGLFMLDELDASIPEVLNILNAAIANRYHTFPAPVGYIEAHPNFRLIAAGNTFGSGADMEYVGRNQLDAATMDRFGMVEINYDPRIEEAMARGDQDLLGFCRAFRTAVSKAGIRAIVSYRAINRMAKMSNALEPQELVKSCLTKALDKADLQMIQDKMQGFGKYSTGFNALL